MLHAHTYVSLRLLLSPPTGSADVLTSFLLVMIFSTILSSFPFPFSLESFSPVCADYLIQQSARLLKRSAMPVWGHLISRCGASDVNQFINWATVGSYLILISHLGDEYTGHQYLKRRFLDVVQGNCTIYLAPVVGSTWLQCLCCIAREKSSTCVPFLLRIVWCNDGGTQGLPGSKAQEDCVSVWHGMESPNCPASVFKARQRDLGMQNWILALPLECHGTLTNSCFCWTPNTEPP